MILDPEKQRRIATHFAISSVLGQLAHQAMPIEKMIQDDVIFFEEWMKESQDGRKHGIDTVYGSPSQAMLDLLKAARDLLAAHRNLMAIGEMVASGTEDTGKYKM